MLVDKSRILHRALLLLGDMVETDTPMIGT